jgi:hypothetical protein
MERKRRQMIHAQQLASQRRISPEEMLRSAIGTLKHEGIYLTDEEKALLMANFKGKISDEEFMKRAYELAMEG